jgi:hypothetical protein
MDIYMAILWLFLLALPIACISWSVSHEEIFREPREYCIQKSLHATTILERKFYFILTCEYCFSHYVTIIFLCLTSYKLLINDWRGYLIAGFSLVWIANVYMSLYGFLRQNIKKEKTEIKVLEGQTRKRRLNQQQSSIRIITHVGKGVPW